LAGAPRLAFADIVTEGYDTILTVPGRDDSASLMVQLNLDVPEPDLSDVEALSSRRSSPH
jgi:hypothetical protein